MIDSNIWHSLESVACFFLRIIAVMLVPVGIANADGFRAERWTGAWGSDGPIITGDFNGDGKTDVMMWRESSKSWTVNLSNGSGFNAQEWKGAWGSDGPIITGDFNGDGKTDVMMWRESSKSWTVNLSNGDGFDAQEWKGNWGSDGPIHVGDLNGDGKSDVFMYRASDHTWSVNLSTGAGFTEQRWTGAWGSDGPNFVGDLNGDETSDVFMWRGSDKSWTVNLSTGSNFVVRDFVGADGSDGPIFTGDLNGDGKLDVFMWRDADKSWTVNLSQADEVSTVDSDMDGILDYLEDRLLARFRPYYKFSIDNGGPEVYHPMDALSFIEHSNLLIENGTAIPEAQLAANPNSLLQAYGNADGSSDYAISQQMSGYALDLDNALRTGDPDWDHIRVHAVGLYGHVAPLHEDKSNPSALTGYRIEYWQLYGFNDAPTDTFRHEGDWENVMLLVEKDQQSIRSVTDAIHSASVTFRLANSKRVDRGGGVIEYQGTGTGKPYRGYIDLDVSGPAGIGWAQDNLLWIYCNGDECTHPMVYVEWGGHESWPTPYWDWIGARNHNGEGLSYLTAVPPNLGEFDHANPRCPGAKLIMHFNGSWGHYNDSPPGPTLHSWAFH
jgi:hypothetical protein